MNHSDDNIFNDFPNREYKGSVMIRMRLVISLALSCVLLFGGKAYAQETPSGEQQATQLITGLEGASGSAIGPDGAMYVTEGAAGRISRFDPQTGTVTTFATGLPEWLIGMGGVIDVAFIDETAYALVTLVADDVGGSDVVGIYRVDGEGSFTVVADLGAFSLENPPDTDFEVPTGVQYALEAYNDGFLVTDGHHNRMLYATLDGEVTEVTAFDNIVPTGLAVAGDTVYMTEAGALPHLPQDGKIASFDATSPTVSDTVSDVASGARLLVDVEVGPDGSLYALSQGEWAGPGEAGSPPLPNTGMLVTVNEDGTFTTVVEGLDQPTSLEFIDGVPYVVTLSGEIWALDSIQEQCTLGTIKGTYLFQAQGVVVEDGEVLPYAEAGIWTLDGEGNAEGVLSASLNGEPYARGDSFTATYENKSGCVFTATDSSGLEYDMFTTPAGETITYFSPGFSGTQVRQ